MAIISYNEDNCEGIFQSAKQLSTIDVAKRYMTIQQRGRNWVTSCPFHDEKTPSFFIYPNGYHCFGCQASGDNTDLVSRLYNLPPLEAAQLICQDFGIPYQQLNNGQFMKQQAEAMERMEWERLAEHLFDTKIDEARQMLLALVRLVRWALSRYGYKAYIEFYTLVHWVDQWEHQLDCLDSEDIELQVAALTEVAKKWL